MDTILSFLKSVPKFVYIIIVLVISFIGTLQYQNYQENERMIVADKALSDTRLSNAALEKSKEDISVASLPVSGTGVVAKKEVSIEKIVPLNSMTTKFKQPIVLGSADFEDTTTGIVMSRNGAFKLGIRIDGNLVNHLNSFMNNQLSESTTIKNKGYEFTFNRDLIITAASVPGIPDNTKANRLRTLYNEMVTAFQTKTDFKSGDTTIKFSDIEEKIVEVKLALVELQKTTIQLPTSDYNGKNILEIMGQLKVD